MACTPVQAYFPHGNASKFIMNLVWETSALSAPQGFRDAAVSAAKMISNAFPLTNITFNMLVGYDDYNNGAVTGLGVNSQGGDSAALVQFVTYSNYRAAYLGVATIPNAVTFSNSLTAGTSINGHNSGYVPSGTLKAVGLLSGTNGAVDGQVGIGASIGSGNLVGVFLHEMTHAMGRESGIFSYNLARFTAVGTRDWSAGSPGYPTVATYFSLDGGTTQLADFGTAQDTSDFKNSGQQDTGGLTDALDEFYSGSSRQVMTTVDIQMMNALGYQ